MKLWPPWPNRKRRARRGRRSRRRSVGYDAAGQGYRLASWQPTDGSANAILDRELPTLRQRSRDLARNNQYAAAIIDRLTREIVGKGIRPRFRTGDERLDRRIAQRWDRWAREAHTSTRLDVYGIQSVAVRAWLESGEVLVRKRTRRRSDGLAVPLQLQILEADMLDGLKTEVRDDGGVIVQGVEHDPIDRRTAYWLHPSHPGGPVLATGLRGFDSRPVPADDIAHLFELQRPGQVRGVPWIAPSLTDLMDLVSYESAEQYRKKIESCLTAFVMVDEEDEEEVAPLDTDQDVGAEDSTGKLDNVTDGEGFPVEEFRPGLIARVRGSKDIKMNQPSSSGGFDEFERRRLKGIASGARMPYEAVTSDYSDATFASTRASAIQWRRGVRALRAQHVEPMLLSPMADWFLDALRADGQIPADASVEVSWRPDPAAEWDREREAKADLMEVRSGFRTLSEVLEARGTTLEEYIEERRRENERLDAASLVLDSDPRLVSNAGQHQEPHASTADLGADEEGGGGPNR